MVNFRPLLISAFAGMLALTSNANEISTTEPLTGTEPLDAVVEEMTYPQSVVDIAELSGLISLSEQVRQAAQVVLAGAKIEATEEKDAEFFSTAEQYQVAKDLSAAWAPEVLQERLLALIAELPEEVQDSALQALRSSAVRLAQAKEKDTVALQHGQKYQLYINKLRQRPPSKARWQMIERLDKQSGFSALIIKARQRAYEVIQQAAPAWQPQAEWQGMAKQEVLEFMFYAYRKTPNAELEKYIQAYNKPGMVTLLTVIHQQL